VLFLSGAHSRSLARGRSSTGRGQLGRGKVGVFNATSKADTRAQYGGFTLGNGVFLFVPSPPNGHRRTRRSAITLRGFVAARVFRSPRMPSPIIFYLLAGEGTCGR